MQAIFRGYQVRRQYRKIIWSVGVLEKVILRWRKKKRGFRGLQVCPDEAVEDQNQESEVEDSSEPAGTKLKSVWRGLLYVSSPCFGQREHKKNIIG